MPKIFAAIALNSNKGLSIEGLNVADSVGPDQTALVGQS